MAKKINKWPAWATVTSTRNFLELIRNLRMYEKKIGKIMTHQEFEAEVNKLKPAKNFKYEISEYKYGGPLYIITVEWADGWKRACSHDGDPAVMAEILEAIKNGMV